MNTLDNMNDINYGSNMGGDNRLNHAQITITNTILEAFKKPIENSFSRFFEDFTQPAGTGSGLNGTGYVQIGRKKVIPADLTVLGEFGDKAPLRINRDTYLMGFTQRGKWFLQSELSRTTEYNMFLDIMPQLAESYERELELLMMKEILHCGNLSYASGNAPSNVAASKPSDLTVDNYLQFADIQNDRISKVNTSRVTNVMTAFFPNADISVLLDTKKNPDIISNSTFNSAQFEQHKVADQAGIRFNPVAMYIKALKGTTGFLGDPTALKTDIAVTILVGDGPSIAAKITSSNLPYKVNTYNLDGNMVAIMDPWGQVSFLSVKWTFGCRLLDQKSFSLLVHATQGGLGTSGAIESSLGPIIDDEEKVFLGDSGKGRNSIRDASITITDLTAAGFNNATGNDCSINFTSPVSTAKVEGADKVGYEMGGEYIAEHLCSVAVLLVQDQKLCGVTFITAEGIPTVDVIARPKDIDKIRYFAPVVATEASKTPAQVIKLTAGLSQVKAGKAEIFVKNLYTNQLAFNTLTEYSEENGFGMGFTAKKAEITIS